MRPKVSLKATGLACLSLLAFGTANPARAQGDQSVYADALTANWQNWSWCATDFNSHDYVHAGAASVKITYTGGWQAFYLDCNTTDTTGYASITFWINGGATSGRTFGIAGIVNGTAGANVPLNQFIAGGSVAANTWRQVTVPLSAIGLSKTSGMTGFWIAETSGNAQAAFYIDDIALAGVNQTTSTAIRVDAAANRHAINALIYGTQGASTQMLADLNSPLSRYGGNTATTYNWQQNASNHAADWYFESIPESSANAGDMVDSFISGALSARAQAMVTIPTIGWVAKLGANRSKLSSFSAGKYGAQQSYDGWMPDAGNGVLTNGQNVAGNDPGDANVAADSTFQQNWIKHITSQFGAANKGGVAYYLLDNEPSIWHSTHRDIHPTGATMDEIKSKTIDYAAKIKASDPNAQVVGPEEWGWSGYFYSGYDAQYGAAHGWNNLPDRAAHGNMDMMPWLLSSLKAYDTANNTKSLDVFSLHYYPQGGEFSSDTSTNMQLLRNRSTRSLWDPNYTDTSWINSQVQLIPRMKSWVSGNYAGLKTAITEYNWGADGHINGATTQADILGIFGREGLDMATRWTTPDPTTPTYKAMKMFRNVDGNNNGFGDVSVSDVAPDPDNVSSFASVRGSDGALTVMLINKALSGTAQTTVSLANFTPTSTAKAWQLTSANAITALADLPVSSPANATPYLTLNLPAQSVTFVAVPAAQSGSGVQNAATFVGADKTTQGTWKGKYGKDGYNVINYAASNPTYAAPAFSGYSVWTWATSTAYAPALQKTGTATDRYAACLYSASNFVVDVNLTDGQTHQVSLYCLDYDPWNRSQTIDVLDASTNAVLSSQPLSSFQNGVYMVWNIKGHVKFRLTSTGPQNAVLSGLFFDDASGTTNRNAANFVKSDTSTSGSWKGVYGTAGYNIINNAASYPAYANVTNSGNFTYTWAASTANSQALQKAGAATDRIASCWYAASNFVVDVNLTDGQTHQVSLYCLDYDPWGRTQTIDVLDADTNAVLSTQNISSYATGIYLAWNIKGHVKFRLTNTGPYNALVSGLFFD